MSLKNPTRVGPQMERAVSIVKANPGCCIRFVAVRIHKAAEQGTNNKLGYNPVHRAINAGLIQSKRLTNGRYILNVTE